MSLEDEVRRLILAMLADDFTIVVDGEVIRPGYGPHRSERYAMHRVEWVGGPNDGHVVDYPERAPDHIDIIEETDPVSGLTLEDATQDAYPPTRSRQVRVPVRDGKAIWADREPRSER